MTPALSVDLESNETIHEKFKSYASNRGMGKSQLDSR